MRQAGKEEDRTSSCVSHSRYGSGGISPPTLFQCAVMSLEGYPVRVAIYNAALTGSRVLILADAWSGMIAWR